MQSQGQPELSGDEKAAVAGAVVVGTQDDDGGASDAAAGAAGASFCSSSSMGVVAILNCVEGGKTMAREAEGKMRGRWLRQASSLAE
jgi:hypothetical protein